MQMADRELESSARKPQPRTSCSAAFIQVSFPNDSDDSFPCAFTVHQTEERIDRVLDSVHDGLIEIEAVLFNPAFQLAKEPRVEVLIVVYNEAF
ncbi:hypothetical protein [Arthrobacter sp. 9V]|uniref:hypothetical protein n=1 Tax=Arthrobacter sp. 9V TaxID=2653132 RepID=UPI00135C4CDF|nr:hypothetical protein [Arthrobacter sp. 9V]